MIPAGCGNPLLPVNQEEGWRPIVKRRLEEFNSPQLSRLSAIAPPHKPTVAPTRRFFDPARADGLGARQIQLRFAQSLREVEIERSLSIHSLRHTFATRLYEKTGDLHRIAATGISRLLQKLLFSCRPRTLFLSPPRRRGATHCGTTPYLSPPRLFLSPPRRRGATHCGTTPYLSPPRPFLSPPRKRGPTRSFVGARLRGHDRERVTLAPFSVTPAKAGGHRSFLNAPTTMKKMIAPPGVRGILLVIGCCMIDGTYHNRGGGG